MKEDNPNIRTCVSVQVDLLDKIIDFSDTNNIPVSDIINVLLQKQVEKLASNPQNREGAMKYQDRGLQYKPVHLKISYIQYRRLRDIMFLFRITLSYMLFLAMQYFDTYLNEFKNNINDKFPPVCHCSILTFFDSLPVYAHYWGIPPAEHTISIPAG
ncbi:MAG TPA: hypothetical protein P5123_01690 [Spirochaetota bacterium]|nr:hypothetical protein [Spirochaetota bacterium]